MTHKQKADELVERFYDPIEDFDLLHAYPETKERIKYAIKCAIICVEEILKASPCVLSSNFSRGFEMTSNAGYWQSVLNELKSRL